MKSQLGLSPSSNAIRFHPRHGARAGLAATSRCIAIVTESSVAPASEVREKFRRAKPLSEISVNQRGWTLDVLNSVRRLPLKAGDEAGARFIGVTSLKLKTGKNLRLFPSSPTNEFTNEDVYDFARELEKLHLGNSHVKYEIRQQLQVLRDAGLLIHVGSGPWRLPQKVDTNYTNYHEFNSRKFA